MTETTRILVGIDGHGDYGPALSLIERLRFPSPQLSLIHAAPERLPIPPGLGDSLGLEERYAQVVANLGCNALHEATAHACGKGLPCEGRLILERPTWNSGECIWLCPIDVDEIERCATRDA